MIDRISVANQAYWPMFVLGALIVLAIFVWKEWRDRSLGWFVPNSMVAFFTVFAVLLLILEPVREIEKTDRVGLILTEGFNENQKDSLLRIHKGMAVVPYDSKKSLRKALDSLTGVYVLGNGMKPFDFWQFAEIPVAFIPAKIPDGITRVKMTGTIAQGETIRIKGRYTYPKKGNRLVLQDPTGTGVDSIQLSEGNGGFSLQTTPKATGLFTYSLAEKDTFGVVVGSEPLPVIIEEKHLLKVLILNTFPTFETKYLKNFLAVNGHKVTVRSQLTRGKYKFEYFNTAIAPIYELTEEALGTIDVLIVDTDTYTNLGKATAAAVERTIKDFGMGLFIQPNAGYFNLPKKRSYFSFERDPLKELKFGSSNTLLEKYPYRFQDEFAAEPILTKETSIIAGYAQIGKGRVASTTLENTYRLLLEGEEKEYNYVWTTLLDKIAKAEESDAVVEPSTLFPRIDAPYEFGLRTNLEGFKVVKQDSIAVPMLQDYLVPTLYSGQTYPRETGWNGLSLVSDSTRSFSYYVFQEKDWKSLETSRTIAANRRAFTTDLDTQRTILGTERISPLWFYLVFLVGIGWLWLAPKRMGA